MEHRVRTAQTEPAFLRHIAFGDGHDKCTRNHKRKRLWTVIRDVTQPLSVNGPWHYVLSAIYYTPEVTAAVEVLLTAEMAQEEISQLAA